MSSVFVGRVVERRKESLFGGVIDRFWSPLHQPMKKYMYFFSYWLGFFVSLLLVYIHVRLSHKF